MAFRDCGVILCLYLLLCFSSQSQSEDYSDEETMYNSENIIKTQDEEENRDDELVCPTPSPLLNGYMSGTNYRHGSIVSFHCNPTYRLIGPSDMTCIAIPSPWKHLMVWDPNNERRCENENGEIYHNTGDVDLSPQGNGHLENQQDTSTEDTRGQGYVYNHINSDPIPYRRTEQKELSELDLLQDSSKRERNYIENNLKSNNEKYEYSVKIVRLSKYSHLFGSANNDETDNGNNDKRSQTQNIKKPEMDMADMPKMPPFAHEVEQPQQDPGDDDELLNCT